MLRARRDITLAGAPARTFARAYDQPSITYGRWVLGWNCILAAVLIYLGWNNLLPNQKTEVPFSEADTPEFDTYYIQGYFALSTKQQEDMDQWIQLIKQEARQSSGEKEIFFVIRQRTPFQKSFEPFSLTMKNDNERFWLGFRCAFLVTNAAAGEGRSYRQVPFRNPRDETVFVDSLDLKHAVRGEYLLILLFARPKDPAKMNAPTTADLNVSVKKS